MKSLLEYSFQKCKDKNIIPDIYDKIVEKSRERIRKALRKNKTNIIIKTIFVLKRYGIYHGINFILGDLQNYNKCLWRLSLFHALSSFIFSKTLSKRKEDIFKTCRNYLPSNYDKKEILKYTEEIEENDLSSYIKVYLSFGKHLLPKIYI